MAKQDGGLGEFMDGLFVGAAVTIVLDLILIGGLGIVLGSAKR